MPNHTKPTPEKRCLMCGMRLQRKRYSTGLLEGVTEYLKRQFCSLSCANSRSKGGLSRKAFHAQARKQKKPNCESCGFKKRLHVHHINEDWTNNNPENLQTLCAFCHQFWHSMHRRLGVKPSTRMPVLGSLWPQECQAELDACEPTATRLTRKSPPNSSEPSER